MKKVILAIALVSTAVTIPQSTEAFPPSPGFGRPNRPTVSPYLNLLPNRNQSAALNYYRAYRPEIEFRQNEQLLGQSIRSLQSEVDRPRPAAQKENSLLGTTGHPTTFGNTSSYFPNTLRR